MKVLRSPIVETRVFPPTTDWMRKGSEMLRVMEFDPKKLVQGFLIGLIVILASLTCESQVVDLGKPSPDVNLPPTGAAGEDDARPSKDETVRPSDDYIRVDTSRPIDEYVGEVLRFLGDPSRK